MAALREAPDPGRHIALLALEPTYGQPGKMLESVVQYALDQLCWHRTTPELLALIEGLRATVTENEPA